MSAADTRWQATRRESDRIGCSNLLHQLTSRQKMFMVLAHFAVDTRVAVAGLLASQYTWQQSSAKLKQLLQIEREPSRFLASLEDSGIVGIWSTAPSGHAESLPNAAADSFCDVRPHCFENCVTEAARRLAPAPAGETVCFIMDWADPMAAASLWVLEDLRNIAEPGVRNRLGTLGFEDARVFAPLRAARWLARACAVQDGSILPPPKTNALAAPSAFCPGQPRPDRVPTL